MVEYTSEPDTAPVWGPLVSVIVIVLANLVTYAANENSWLFKHLLRPLGMPPILFISNRADNLDKHTRPLSYWAFDLLDSEHLVHSNCLSTPLLLVLHACTFLYFAATVVVDVVIDYYRVWCRHPGCNGHSGAYVEWMTFLTNWSISLLGIAGLLAFINTARHWRRQRGYERQQQTEKLGAAGAAQRSRAHVVASPGPGAQPAAHVSPAAGSGGSSAGSLSADLASRSGADGGCWSNRGPADTVVVVEGPLGEAAAADSRILQRRLRQQWDWLSCVHCILMEVATTAAFFVAFWYWVGVVAIAGRGFTLSAGTLMAHAGNAFMALLEVVLTRLPIVSYHFQVLLWYATLYLIFLWAFGGATEIWRYGLDWQQSKPAGAFCIIPIITFIMFALWYLAARIRESMLCAARKRAYHHHRHHHHHHHNNNNNISHQAASAKQHTCAATLPSAPAAVPSPPSNPPPPAAPPATKALTGMA